MLKETKTEETETELKGSAQAQVLHTAAGHYHSHYHPD